MKRSDIHPLPQYFDQYILLCDDVDVMEALELQIQELKEAPWTLWKRIGNKTYADNKWTIPDILQHLIDTERIFQYRALCYARGEKAKVLTFDEDAYAKESGGGLRSLESLQEELFICHQSSWQLFHSLAPSTLNRMCQGFKGEYSVGSVGFILAGHQRWHFRVIEERYHPLHKLSES